MVAPNNNKGGLNPRARVALFLLLPFIVGSFGFTLSYFTKKYTGHTKEVNFDTDFILPFLLTFVLVTVIMIQTQGFKTTKAKGIVTWPKMIKKKKIIRKTVIVDDDGNEITDEKILKQVQVKLSETKKNI